MHTQDDVVLRTVLGDVSAVECLNVLLSAEATSGAEMMYSLTLR